MPNFKIIDNLNNIQLSDDWTDSIKFNSKDKVVGENGKPVDSNYNGRHYRLISKKERQYSSTERIGRGFLGTMAVVISLGTALLFKSVRNLFIKEKEIIRFGVVVPLSSNSQNPSPVAASTNLSQVNRENTVDLQPQEQQKNVKPKEKPAVSPNINTIKNVAEYNISKEELQNGVSISENTISKIQTCMKKVLQRKEKGGVKLYDSQGNHRVFSLDTAPEYIFKMKANKNCGVFGRDDSMKARYQTMINAQTVCRTHQLGLLVIPNAKLFTVEAEGEEYEIIAEKKLDLNSNESAQEQYFEEYASSLNETIRQLAVFICKTGYSDVEWCNNPILNNSLNELGQRKIGLIDIEEMDSKTTGLFGGGFGRRGLVRCVNHEQGKIVEKVAKENGASTSSFASAYARRKEEIEEGRKLKNYYAEKNIVTGYEPVQVDINTLGLDLNEEAKIKEIVRDENGEAIRKDKKLVSQKRVITLEEATKYVIEEINKSIQKKPEGHSAKGTRYFLLNTNHGPLRTYNGLGVTFDESGFQSSREEDTKKIWMRRIINSLVEKGHLFNLDKVNGHGYFIQA